MAEVVDGSVAVFGTRSLQRRGSQELGGKGMRLPPFVVEGKGWDGEKESMRRGSMGATGRK